MGRAISLLAMACLVAHGIGCDDEPDGAVDPGRADAGDAGPDGGPPRPAGEAVYYVRDHTRSVVAAVDPEGAPVADVTFDAYGMPTAEADAIDDWSFADARLDPGSGLIHFGARQYSARLGRFYDVDPIFKELGDSQSPMRYEAYTYGASDPVNLTDLGGLAAILHVFYGSTVPGGLPSGTGLLYDLDDRGRVTGAPRVVSVNNPGISNGTLTMFFEDEDADDVLDETFELPAMGRDATHGARPALVHDAYRGFFSISEDVTVVRSASGWSRAPRAEALEGRDIDVTRGARAPLDAWSRGELVSQGRESVMQALRGVATSAPKFEQARREFRRMP